jgi:pyruvate dehydrogenase E2 component (dihydrolipoamide acetyltransferase)
MEIPAPSAGILKALSIDVGSKISQGDVIGQLQVAGNTQEAVATSSEQTPQAAAERGTVVPIQSAIREEKPAAATAVEKDADFGRVPHASPSVRKLARELDVPLSKVTATGVKGRITRDDVFLYVKQVMKQQANADSQSTSAGGGMPGVLPWPKVDFEKFGEVERKALPRIRKISGANLHRNWVTIPHVTNHEDADISDLEAFRQQLNKELSREGKKVTLLAFMVKACVAALKQFPEFNSSLDGEELVLKNYYHIGFAADTPNGLVVPVIRDADKKGIIEIAEDIQSLSSCARDGKLSAADMSGGCFSISSLGGIGGTYFTPIINAPEVAILGVAKAKTQLVWNGEAAEPRLILPMSLSWDHRVVDGAQAGKFNAYLSAVLSDFRRISL